MSTPPRISVIVPNYNYARYLEIRLNSIFQQTRQDFEVIYLDDASTDGSKEEYERLAGDPRMRAVFNTSNSGSAFAQWNKGVKEARGEFIWIAEADDIADERLLEVLTRRLENDPQCGIAYCASQFIDEDGKVTGRAEDELNPLDAKRWHHDFENNGRDECARYLIQRNTIFNASAVVFRKEAYLKAGCADEQLKLCGDWITWARMLYHCNVAYTGEPLNHFRKHAQSVRSTTSDARHVWESYCVVNDILKHVTVEKPLRDKVFDRLAKAWILAVMPKENAAGRRYNRAIYRAARGADKNLHSRLRKNMTAFLRERTGTRLNRFTTQGRKGAASS